MMVAAVGGRAARRLGMNRAAGPARGRHGRWGREGGGGRRHQVGELLGQRQVGPGQESAAHLYVGGVGPARVTLLPVERSGHRVARGDLVGVFDELL
jgi:hypothetical protein